jgi:hypothetical protein
MANICVPIPPLEYARSIELEVKVNGKRRVMSYRVERFDWKAEIADATRRIEHLQAQIGAYDPGWELVQIGNPGEHFIPVMFRERSLA